MMAAILELGLEKAAEAMLSRALLARAAGAVGAAGVAAGTADALATKDDDAARAGAAPIAPAGVRADERRKCQRCPPDAGALVGSNSAMPETSRDYQARITGFHPWFEWRWLGVDFDGFRSERCLLLEAKARYDQFFDDRGKPTWFFAMTGEPGILRQATRQGIVVTENASATLHWHFMQPMSHAWFTRQFSVRGLSITTFLTP